MIRNGWRDEMVGRVVVEAVLSRLDAVGALIDEGRYREAREALYATRWAAELDLTVMPGYTAKRIQQWVSAAYDGLSEMEVDPAYVRNLLFQARRVLTQ